MRIAVAEVLEIRSARIEELHRDSAHRRLSDDNARSPKVQAARAEDEFWRSVDRLWGPADGHMSREGRQAHAQGMRDLDLVEQADQARESAVSAEPRQMWHGALPDERR